LRVMGSTDRSRVAPRAIRDPVRKRDFAPRPGRRQAAVASRWASTTRSASARGISS
jgi:hypothetical protein